MQLKKTMRRVFAGTLSGIMMASMVPQIPASAADICTINTGKTYQYIRGFGGIDLPEWQGYSLSDAELKRAFGNGDNELGLTVLRVFVNPDSSKWGNCLKTAQYATKQGATIFATPWEPPANLAESGGSNGKLHLPSYNYGAYANHLNSFISYMKNNGVNLYSISVQNEPDYAHDWTYWSPEETTNFLANYGDKITGAKLMSPETFQYGAWSAAGRNYYNNILKNSKAMANTDLFGTHFYGTPRSKMDFPDLENSGKEIWMTEVYVPNSNANSANNWPEAIEVAENIHNGLVMGNMSVYTWWYIKRSYSLLEQNGSNGGITKRGYMMAQYSKYIRPGDYRIDCTECPSGTSDVYISAYRHSDTQIEIVAVNKGDTTYSQQFSVGNRAITNVDRYRTTSSENLAKTANMDHESSTFWANLPSKSVSTFVVTLKSDGSVQPEDPNPGNNDTPVVNPDANGYYFHDTFEDSNCDWEARGGSDVEAKLSGRHPYAGTNALLVMNRSSAWHGLQKELPTSTYKPGQKYSFSVCVDYEDGEDEQAFYLSMQYDDASGTTKYAHLAEGTTYPGQYLHLKNTSFQIPEGASNVKLYVETPSGTCNFYIDEAIVAKDGTQISGPASPSKPVKKLTTTVSSEAGYGAVKLNWDAVSGAEKYAVYGYTGGNWKQLAEGDTTSYVIKGLKINTNYKVAVVVKASGEWNLDFSNAITVTPLVPSFPTVTSIDYNKSTHQFKVTWNKVEGATKYGVAIKQNGKWSLKLTTNSSTTSFVSPQCKAGSNYEMVVCAYVGGKWDTRETENRKFYVNVQ